MPENNAAPGQENFPLKNDPGNHTSARSGEEIINGARQEDQLDKMKEEAKNLTKDPTSEGSTETTS
jgi:hypothetical protein